MKKYLVVLTVLSVVFLVFTIYEYNNYFNDRLERGIEKGTSTVVKAKHHLDSISEITTQSVDYLVNLISRENKTPAELENLIKTEASKLSHINGIAVAFAPYAYDERQKLFSVFYQTDKGAFFHAEDYYDYTDSTLSTTEWYTKTVNKLRPILTSPYYGQISSELVIGYSVPIFRNGANGNKILYGVVSYLITPDKFTEVVNSFVNGNSGYIYLTDNKGVIITHPNRSYILNMDVLDYKSDKSENALRDYIMNNKAGYVNYVSPYTSVPSILFFETADLTGWKMAVVYSRADLMGSQNILQRKIINISISISLVLIFLLALLLKVYSLKTKSLWIFSILTSLIFILNVSLIWYIQLNIDYSEELKNTTRVYSNDALASYVDKKNYEGKLLGKSNYLEIPTGLFLEELFVTDSYDMSVSGKIWQKWPVNHDLKDNIGFHFIQAAPGGRSVFVELLSKDRIDSATWLYTWQFSAKLRVFFDYDQYPLDQHYIDIRLIYPDMTDEIMLVPDFASYEVLNPSSKPGMSDVIFLPKHRIIASYFSFSSLDMKTFFGQNRGNSSAEYEALEYNVVIKRRFITPFISFIIPFLLGSAIIFFLIFSLSRKKEENSGVTVMGVVQGMAALFFSMLLANITIRNRIPAPHITYLETFYIIIYIMIVLLIVLVVIYSKSTRFKWLNFRDNLILKVLYWPLLYGMVYVVTLLRFY